MSDVITYMYDKEKPKHHNLYKDLFITLIQLFSPAASKTLQ